MSKTNLTKGKGILHRLGMTATSAEVLYERSGHHPKCARGDECACNGDYPEVVAVRGVYGLCVLQEHANCMAFLAERAHHFPRRPFLPDPEGFIGIRDDPDHPLREIYPSQTLAEYSSLSEPFRSPWLTTAMVRELAKQPVRWLWEPYIAPRAVTSLYADTGAGKSTLIANLLTRMLAGEQDFLDCPISPAFVLYLTEDPPIALEWRTEPAPFAGLRTSDRVRWLRQGTVIPRADKDAETIPERVTEWNPREGTGYKSLLIEAAKRHRESALAHLPLLIVIDTITTFLGFEDGNTSTDVAEAMSELSLLADTTGAAVLALHHARKPKDGTYRVTYLGSVQFKAQSDIFLVLQRQALDKENRQRSLEMEKTRLLYKEPLPILFGDQKTYNIDANPPKRKGKQDMEARYREIFRVAQKFPKEGFRGLSRMLPESDKTIKAALDYAEEHGWDEEPQDAP